MGYGVKVAHLTLTQTVQVRILLAWFNQGEFYEQARNQAIKGI